jgi:hypothetical protein
MTKSISTKTETQFPTRSYETRAALAAILDKAAIEIELFEEDWEKVADELTATQAAAIEKLNVALPDPLQDCPRDLTRGEGGVRAAAARPGESDLLLSLGCR